MVISWCRKDILTHFLNSGHWKERFGRSRVNGILGRRMAQWPHNLPFGSLKKRLWWIRWRCFKSSKGLTNWFSESWSSKKKSDEFAEVKIYVGEWSSELIICLLEVLKNDFFEDDEVTIQDFKRPWVLIFGYLGIENSELFEISWVMFEAGECPCISLFDDWTS
jgi:hypothetical protein